MYTQCLRRCRIRLPRDEEARLAKAMRRGDLAARNALIESQLPYIVRLATPFVGPHLPLEDLAQVGVLILIRVLRKFRPSRGRLSTFCTAPIRYAFLNYSVKHRSLISRPAYRPAPHLSEAWDKALETTSIGDADSQEFAVAGETPPALTYIEEDLDERRRLHAAIDELDPRQCKVLRGRLKGLLLRELADELGVTRERVRQIELEAIKRLRRKLLSPGDQP